MADQDDRRRPHFILSSKAESEPFKSVQQGGAEKRILSRDRVQHGQRLMGQLRELTPRFSAGACRRRRQSQPPIRVKLCGRKSPRCTREVSIGSGVSHGFDGSQPVLEKQVS